MIRSLRSWLQSSSKATFAYRCLLLAFVFSIPLALAFQYKAALPGYQYHFPQDHAAHPDYKTEWWYYTGHLQTTGGKHYGYELTFFRIGNDPKRVSNNNTPWSTNNLYAAHFALSDEQNQQFHFSEKLNRSGLNVAGARTDAYYVWNELWLAEQLGNQMILRADSPDGKQEIHLLLTAEKLPVIHGENGVSQKADCVGCASHYYSLTRLKTEGMLLLDGKAYPVTGLSWMDHEFGSNQLAKNQKGWDWFSIQLNDNTELMLYLLRQENGQIDPNSSGTWVDADGHTRHLPLNAFSVKSSGTTWTSPASKGIYPMGWTVTIPSEQLSLTITPAFNNQELFTPGSTGVSYWEGSSHISGTRQGHSIAGQAYVEMTGYAAQSVKGKL
jgi:predicted secreted hydrolase